MSIGKNPNLIHTSKEGKVAYELLKSFEEKGMTADEVDTVLRSALYIFNKTRARLIENKVDNSPYAVSLKLDEVERTTSLM